MSAVATNIISERGRSQGLWSRALVAVLLAQFLSAMADNALLFGALALLRNQHYPPWTVPLLQEFFVGAFILLAPFVGPFADSRSKGAVMLIANGLMGALVRGIVPPDSARAAMRIFGFVDGYLGLILVLSAMQLPLALWIIKTYFDLTPKDYEEAALMDGANGWQRAHRILVPLALPGLGAAGLLTFIGAWGDFLMPLTFTSSVELQLLPIGLFRAFQRANTIDYGYLSALAVLYMLPAVVAFGFARRFLIQSFTGGIKG